MNALVVVREWSRIANDVRALGCEQWSVSTWRAKSVRQASTLPLTATGWRPVDANSTAEGLRADPDQLLVRAHDDDSSGTRS